MRINEAKRRLMQGESVIGIGLGLGSPLAGELLSLAGFDFILVDNQHGAWDDNSSMAAFRSICYGPATPMIRVQKNDYYVIGRALDRGALGIIVPMVNTADEARQAARAVRFPPRGERSIGPFGTAFLGEDYVSCVNDEVYLAVQIETARAAANAEEILSVEGVDGCWCGPGDMGLSMGLRPGSPEEQPELEAALMGVLEACHKTGKVPGLACVPGNARYWLNKGFRFVTIGGEGSLLRSAAQQVLASLRQG